MQYGNGDKGEAGRWVCRWRWKEEKDKLKDWGLWSNKDYDERLGIRGKEREAGRQGEVGRDEGRGQIEKVSTEGRLHTQSGGTKSGVHARVAPKWECHAGSPRRSVIRQIVPETAAAAPITTAGRRGRGWRKRGIHGAGDGGRGRGWVMVVCGKQKKR